MSEQFAAFSLLVLTFVATAAVHWPDMIAMWGDLAKGYAITDKGFGNFKLPLLFCVMLLPLILPASEPITPREVSFQEPEMLAPSAAMSLPRSNR